MYLVRRQSVKIIALRLIVFPIPIAQESVGLFYRGEILSFQRLPDIGKYLGRPRILGG
jgi:hypothetical protein